MLRAGRLDRKITLERDSGTGTDSIGHLVESWGTLEEVWVEIIPVSGKEVMQMKREVKSEVKRFTIRYRSDVTAKDRINYDGKLWDIFYIREIGRRVGTEILAELNE